jgi:hypothetical protein
MRSFLTRPELKGTQTLTRERIKKDLKESASVYADLAKRIPKIKEAYLKRCQELKVGFSAFRSFDVPARVSTFALVDLRRFQDLDPSSNSPLNGAMPSSLLGSDFPSTSDIVSPPSTRFHHPNRSSVLSVPLSTRMPSTTGSLTESTRHSNANVTNRV